MFSIYTCNYISNYVTFGKKKDNLRVGSQSISVSMLGVGSQSISFSMLGVGVASHI